MTTSFTLWIEAEEWPAGEWDPAVDATDAVATLDDGSRWIASFCPFAGLAALRERCAETGENLGGRYLWGSDLILVESTRREELETVVRDLLGTGDLPSAFGRLEDDAGE